MTVYSLSTTKVNASKAASDFSSRNRQHQQRSQTDQYGRIVMMGTLKSTEEGMSCARPIIEEENRMRGISNYRYLDWDFQADGEKSSRGCYETMTGKSISCHDKQ